MTFYRGSTHSSWSELPPSLKVPKKVKIRTRENTRTSCDELPPSLKVPKKVNIRTRENTRTSCDELTPSLKVPKIVNLRGSLDANPTRKRHRHFFRSKTYGVPAGNISENVTLKTLGFLKTEEKSVCYSPRFFSPAPHKFCFGKSDVASFASG